MADTINATLFRMADNRFCLVSYLPKILPEKSSTLLLNKGKYLLSICRYSITRKVWQELIALTSNTPHDYILWDKNEICEATISGNGELTIVSEDDMFRGIYQSLNPNKPFPK